MNRLILLLNLMLFCGLISCNGSGKSNETVKVVEKTDSCKLDTKNSYEVYVPARKQVNDKMPLLIIIDSHGSGRFALAKFKSGANQYPVILIASNLIKNGFNGYEEAIQTLINDVHQKYPVNETIFLTGFSGGARMVLGYGLTHPVNGLIMCGALANPDQLTALSCPVISISGMDDFNFMETAQYLFQEKSTPANLKIELTNASHSWPDSVMLANALGFLSFTVKDDDVAFRNESGFKLYCQTQHARINLLKQQGHYLKATLVARNMAITQPFKNAVFMSTYRELKNNPGYINELSRLEKCINFEISMRQTYIDAFRTKDSLWWKNEIITTDVKIKTEKESFTKDMYRRIKGFWGIACYTLCKQTVKERNAAALNKILFIYRSVEPVNPDMLYFSSFPSYWTGKNELTISLLKTAMKAGFSDMNQLKKDFNETISSKF